MNDPTLVKMHTTADEIRALAEKYGCVKVDHGLNKGQLRQLSEHKPNGIHAGIKRRMHKIHDAQ